MHRIVVGLALAAWTPAFAGDHQDHVPRERDRDEGEVAIPASDLPEPVMQAISAKYPGSSIDDAVRDGETYEVKLVAAGKSHTLAFDEAGNLLEAEEIVAETDAPAEVQAAIAARYEKWTVDGMELSVTPAGTVYETKLVRGERRIEVAFDPNGAVVAVERE